MSVVPAVDIGSDNMKFNLSTDPTPEEFQHLKDHPNLDGIQRYVGTDPDITNRQCHRHMQFNMTGEFIGFMLIWESGTDTHVHLFGDATYPDPCNLKGKTFVTHHDLKGTTIEKVYQQADINNIEVVEWDETTTTGGDAWMLLGALT